MKKRKIKHFKPIHPLHPYASVDTNTDLLFTASRRKMYLRASREGSETGRKEPTLI